MLRKAETETGRKGRVSFRVVVSMMVHADMERHGRSFVWSLMYTMYRGVSKRMEECAMPKQRVVVNTSV